MLANDATKYEVAIAIDDNIIMFIFSSTLINCGFLISTNIMVFSLLQLTTHH